ncbi:MAG: hypothetical protein ACFCU4_02925 [Puniceicoccaceae bacterium]
MIAIQLSTRERLLLLTIALIALAWWGLSLLGTYRQVWNNYRTARLSLEQANLQLDLDPDIRQRLNDALALLESGRFLSANQFVERADQIARRAGVLPNLGRVNTREGQGVRLYTLDLELRALRVEDLIKLENLLRNESPYLQIESIFIRSRRNSAIISSDFVLTAFEVDLSILNQ